MKKLSALLKRFFNFTVKHWIISTTVVVLGIFFVSVITFSNNAATTATTIVPKADSLVLQINSVVGTSNPTDLTAKQIATKKLKDTVPVTVVPSTDFINSLETYGKLVSSLTINPTLHNVAIAYGNTATTEQIVVAKYLDAQVPTILETASTAGVEANVVYVGTGSTTYTSNGYSGTGNMATNTNTYSNGVETTNTQTEPMNPWYMAGMIAVYAVLFFVFLRILGRFVFRRPSKSLSAIGGNGTAGNGSKKKSDDGGEIPTTTFADIAGCDEAIEEMQELVEFIQHPERFTKVGAKAPKGALLVGPPGTGKTLLARAVAGEAGIPFFSAAGSDFVEMYVGVGAKRVRELFTKARKSENGAIVFIDEIDAIGRKRGNGEGAGNSEQENTLNALLVELDGFTQSKVIILGATNRDDMLDKALLRPGRLDKKVWVPLPDRQGRERILAVHTKNKPIDKNVDFTLIARRTPGMSGAELEQIANEAAMHAARDNRSSITVNDFDDAIATVTMGKARKSAVISEADRDLTAWHEAGHALCGLLQEDGLNPASISIIPRGMAGGVTHFPARDSGYMTRKQAYSQLVTAMGGMAAEQLHLGEGEFTTGPSSDLQQASNIALAMVTQYGMGENLFVKGGDILNASSTSTDEAVEEADSLLHKALEDAKTLLTTHSKLVYNFVDALIEYETLNSNQIKELMDGHKIVATTTAPPAPRQTTRPEKSMVKKVKFKPVAKKKTLFGKVIGSITRRKGNL